MKTDVAIVGAGPAGMMAAGQAARAGARVLVLEKNPRPGRKLMITGKGRCNITNNCDTEAFLAAVRSNPRFLFSAASAFPSAETGCFRSRTRRGMSSTLWQILCVIQTCPSCRRR